MVYRIYRDHQGSLWFGTAVFGACRYDGSSFGWLYDDHLSNMPGGGAFGIRSIHEDKEGKFWFCNTRYRYSILPDTADSRKAQRLDYTREEGIDPLTHLAPGETLYYQSILEDPQQHLWMSPPAGGVYVYDGEKLRIYPVKVDGKDIRVFSLFMDQHDAVWIGTLEHGAWRFNGSGFEPFAP
jgi:ligand-binding sensor domain-containing protein